MIKFYVMMSSKRCETTGFPLFWNAEKKEWVHLEDATPYPEENALGFYPEGGWGWLQLPETLFAEFQAYQYESDAKAAALADDIPF